MDEKKASPYCCGRGCDNCEDIDMSDATTPTEREREEARRLAFVKEHNRRAGVIVPILLSFQRTQYYAENVAHRIVAWAEGGFKGNP